MSDRIAQLREISVKYRKFFFSFFIFHTYFWNTVHLVLGVQAT